MGSVHADLILAGYAGQFVPVDPLPCELVVLDRHPEEPETAPWSKSGRSGVGSADLHCDTDNEAACDRGCVWRNRAGGGVLRFGGDSGVPGMLWKIDRQADREIDNPIRITTRQRALFYGTKSKNILTNVWEVANIFAGLFAGSCEGSILSRREIKNIHG